MIDLLYRTFPLEAAEIGGDDGRTVEGLAVPFNRETPVVDRRPDGRVVRYRERFIIGAFDRAEAVPHRVTFVYGHSDSFAERLGHAETITQRADGLFIRFRLDPSRAESARDALATSHGALSIGFASIIPRRDSEEDGSLVTREAVHLMHVAAVPAGAYPDALVTSVRDAGDELALLDAEAEQATRAAAEVAHARSCALLSEIDGLVASQSVWRQRIGAEP